MLDMTSGFLEKYMPSFINFDTFLQFPVGPLKQNTSDGNVVSELLDKLMVLTFDHLETCQNSGRLDEVWHQMVYFSFPLW